MSTVTEWIIERAAGHRIVGLLHDLKELRADNWDVTALLEPGGSVVGLGYHVSLLTEREAA